MFGLASYGAMNSFTVQGAWLRVQEREILTPKPRVRTLNSEP